MYNDDELRHYGVLGMRWGVRRANKNLNKAKRLRKEGKTEKAARIEKKFNKKLKKHERYSGGKKAINYTRKESLGKSVVKSMLIGTYGTLRYNEARASGANRGQAAVRGVLYQIGNAYTGGLLSIAEPRFRR